MSRVYFFSNETKNEFVYVSNVGTYSMEIETIVETICQKKKWEASDKVVIISQDGKRMSSYCYQNKIFSFFDFKNNPKYEWVEIETNEDEICNEESMRFEDYDEDYDDYNYEDIEDDRYDERDDYNEGNGYEDESFECCDMY
jgi:hypothetical protein